MACCCPTRIRDNDGRLWCLIHGDVTNDHGHVLTEAECRLKLQQAYHLDN